jgi:hypothetical protein
VARLVTLPRAVGVAALVLASGAFVVRVWAEDGDGSGTACTTVYHAQSEGDDAIGELCAVLDRTGQRVDRVSVTLTARRSACDDAVSLSVSSTGRSGDLSRTDKVDCIADRAEATFDIGQVFEVGAEICGSLPDDAPYDRFRPARACVTVPAP